MKFIVDAQLPRRLASWLQGNGHDAVHTLDMPDANRTTDSQINDLAEQEQRIVVTKDADFVNSFVLLRRPPKLLLISTGNIRNADLEALFIRFLPAIVVDFQTSSFIEMDGTGYVVHS